MVPARDLKSSTIAAISGATRKPLVSAHSSLARIRRDRQVDDAAVAHPTSYGPPSNLSLPILLIHSRMAQANERIVASDVLIGRLERRRE